MVVVGADGGALLNEENSTRVGAESGEVGAEASGQASARGSASLKERRAAELLDTVARREDDGERGYDDSAAAGASAMAGEGEGERQVACGGVQVVEGATWRSTSASRGAGGKNVAP